MDLDRRQFLGGALAAPIVLDQSERKVKPHVIKFMNGGANVFTHVPAIGAYFRPIAKGQFLIVATFFCEADAWLAKFPEGDQPLEGPLAMEILRQPRFLPASGDYKRAFRRLFLTSVVDGHRYVTMEVIDSP